ncbi:MAG: hypothetical protein R3C97_08640 [Geminicoccaceae bacterium]
MPDEFCPGTYSVNIAGRRKIAGLAQRLGKQAYHLGAVILVGQSGPASDAMISAYAKLQLPLDPNTIGAIRNDATNADFTAVTAAILDHLSEKLGTIEGERPASL